MSAPDMEWLRSKVELLTPGQLTEFKAAFDLYDQDGDGKITTKELKDTLTSMAMDPSEKQLQIMINAVDFDGNGSLDLDEFLMMMAAKLHNKEIVGSNWAHKVPIPYVWDESFATMYKKLDDEHRYLFQKIWECFESRDSQYCLLNMVANMQAHFTSEEASMKASKHDNYTRHKQVHDAYMEKLKHFTVPVADKDIKYCMSWLVNHIKNTDFKYKGKLLFDKSGTELRV